MNGSALIAKRYAQAFLNLYVASLSDLDIEHAHEAIQFLSRNHSFIALLKVPHIPDSAKVDALAKVLIDKYGLPEIFTSLFNLLVHDKRAAFIVPTLEQIKRMYRARKGVEFFVITSSHALEHAELDALQKFLAKKTGHTIYYTYHVDPSLIAGIRMQSSQRLWEYSIKNQLASLDRVYGN